MTISKKTRRARLANPILLRKERDAKPGKKRCPMCSEEKTWTEYSFNKQVRDGCATYCKACSVKRMVQWQRDNREKYRERVRNWRFGITTEQWNVAFEAQGQCCALCQSPTPSGKWGWHTDHNHETGEFRGILCLPCNYALGAFEKRILPIWERFETYRKRTTGIGRHTARLIRAHRGNCKNSP